ncbi:MAG: hypothetical protein ABIP48_19580, partial [Planctomycetota bacterium]
MLTWKILVSMICCTAPVLQPAAAEAQPDIALTVENEYTTLAVGANGQALRFTDRKSGVDYSKQAPPSPFARVKKEGKSYAATKATYSDERLSLEFGD